MIRATTQLVVSISLLGSLLFCTGCGGARGLNDRSEIRGAGASFPAPLYQRWAIEYSKQNEGVKVEYASVGSGAGIRQFTEELVDYAASDAAMTDDEIAAIQRGVQLLPMTAGSIVLAYNLPGIDHLKLSRDAYVGIFLGEIDRWNDPEIARHNPGVELPDMPVSVAYRADSSGTTFVFTNHLASISDAWKNGPGVDKQIEWPTGAGAPKNDGIAGAVKQSEGTIGYIEYGFAAKNKISMASLENASGSFVAPNTESGRAALASAEEIPEDFRIWVPDPAASEAYPIVTYTWVMCYQNYGDATKLASLKAFLKHCLQQGQTVSEEMGYIPLPESITNRAIEAIESLGT